MPSPIPRRSTTSGTSRSSPPKFGVRHRTLFAGDRLRDGLDYGSLVPDRRLDPDIEARILLLRLPDESRQVFFHVPAGAEEYGHHADRRDLGRDAIDRFRERWLHH